MAPAAAYAVVGFMCNYGGLEDHTLPAAREERRTLSRTLQTHRASFFR